MGPLPHEAKVVVIGGGIAGCSTAYHLADNGWNTVLIERDVLTSGTTWHSAGMVTQLGTTPQITKIRKNSVKFYNDLKIVLLCIFIYLIFYLILYLFFQNINSKE